MSTLTDIKIVETADGSHTLFSQRLNETYHSTFGAITESQCVFIQNGLHHFLNAKNEISILETGMGTGLNAFMTFLEAEKNKQKIVYHSLELYPIPLQIITQLNYSQQLNAKSYQQQFLQLHECDFETENRLSEYFVFKKSKVSIKEFVQADAFDIVYFDAFSPDVNTDLWENDVLQNMYKSLKTGGILTTYCAKGVVKRALKQVGFMVRNMPGPPGKREITIAEKVT